jgi:NAD(P)-dependent dehydrogenase (short-subunit alcohol dehydrogenase family)
MATVTPQAFPPNPPGYRKTAEEISQGIDLKGKVAIVTGASSGLGVETSRVLALRGAHVILAVRDTKKAEPFLEQIKKSTNNDKVEIIRLDLGSFDSVREFAKQFLSKNLPLNILINNAGIMAVPLNMIEGYESQLATNHFGHWLLTTLLLPALIQGKPSRVVSVSSCAHKRLGVNFDDINFEKQGYDKWKAYAQSKTANVLFALEFDKRYRDKGVSAFALHPGGIMTGLQSSLSKEEMLAMGWFDKDGKINDRFKTIEQGAATSIYAATSPELEGKGGLYLEDCDVSTIPPEQFPFAGWAEHAKDMKAAGQLWELSEKATKHTPTV